MFTVLTLQKKWYGNLLFLRKPKVFLCGDKNGCYYKVVSNREYTYKDMQEVKKLCGVAFNRLAVTSGVSLLPEFERYIAKPKMLRCNLAADLAMKFLSRSNDKRVTICDKNGAFLDKAYRIALECSSVQVITNNVYPYYRLKERLLYEEGIVLTVLDREVEPCACAIDFDGDARIATEKIFAPFGEKNIVPVGVAGDDYKHLYIEGIDDFYLLQLLYEWGNAEKLCKMSARYFVYNGEKYKSKDIKLLT